MAAELERLRELAATCYAGLGAECNLPENWLDALLAASDGEPFSIDGLLPFKAQPATCGNTPYDEGPFTLAQQPAPSAAALRVALEQAARQALETLERASDAGYSVECDETITALREALEQVAPRKTEQWNPMDSSNAETALQMAVVIAHRDTEAAHQQATPQADSVTAPATDSYVQPVPDKCDRIVWRGHYYHLPPTAQAADSVLEGAARESEYRRGYRHGYEQRDAEVRGALA